MKNIFYILFILVISNNNSFAKKTKTIQHPIVGTWKYSNKTSVNEFEKLQNATTKQTITTEYFMFNSDKNFNHYFIGENDVIVKSLCGSWKLVDNKIQIKYNDVKFELLTDFFFIGNDLILGKTFNHIVFTTANNLDNIAMAKK